MNFPKPSHGLWKLVFAVLADPSAVFFMRHLLSQDTPHLAPIHKLILRSRRVDAARRAQKVPKVIRHADVLPQGLLGVERRAGGPAEQQGLDQGRIGDAGVGGADAGEEPGRVTGDTVQDAESELLDGVKVRAAVEDAALLGPGV